MNMQKNIKQILFILVLALISFSFLPKTASALDWGAVVDSSGNFGVAVGSGGNSSYGGLNMDSHGLPSGSIFGILQNLLNWLLALFGIFGIIGFVLSGIFYLISAGDEGMAEKGKEGMKWSIMGVIVGLSGYVIMQAVQAMLNSQSGF